MKDRVNNIKTTAIAIVVAGVATAGLILKWFDWQAFAALMGLAYTFLMAKDSLIEGITMGAFKATKKDPE